MVQITEFLSMNRGGVGKDICERPVYFAYLPPSDSNILGVAEVIHLLCESTTHLRGEGEVGGDIHER